MTFVLLWVGFPVCPNPHLIIEQASRHRTWRSPGYEHFIYTVTSKNVMMRGWLKLSEKSDITETAQLELWRKKKPSGADPIPNHSDEMTVSPPSAWLALWNVCHIDPLVPFNLKARGRSFGVTESVRLKLDRTGWDKWTLASSGAVNTCLSFPRFKDVQPNAAARHSAALSSSGYQPVSSGWKSEKDGFCQNEPFMAFVRDCGVISVYSLLSEEWRGNKQGLPL